MFKNDKRRILIAPLDWGLGHATRCIPIIRQLLDAGFEILIAADGKQKVLLQAEFPSLTFLILRGYQVSYSRNKLGLYLKIFAQIPKILSAIRLEHRWLKQMVEQHRIGIVISDNRYGLYNKHIYSIFITHQLSIQASIFSNLVRILNYRYINRFSACWIPDEKKEDGLAGALSHPEIYPKAPAKYIGVISRFFYKEGLNNKKHVLILLSGPEPQRTILENKLIGQLIDCKLPVLFVRGLPGYTNDFCNLPAQVTAFSHLESEALQTAIRDASFVIARCGYSTVMDLARMRKQAILIPTPGQTEQEYLAQHLSKKRLALTIDQQKFNLSSALRLAASFPYQPFIEEEGLLTGAIRELEIHNPA